MQTKYIVRIFFDRKWKEHECFYLSVKQYNKLASIVNKAQNANVKNTVVLAVFDGDRFVWPGIEYTDYTDRDWLEKTFNAEYSDRFIITNPEVTRHIPEKIEPKETEPDANLIR